MELSRDEPPKAILSGPESLRGTQISFFYLVDVNFFFFKVAYCKLKFDVGGHLMGFELVLERIAQKKSKFTIFKEFHISDFSRAFFEIYF